MTRSSSLSSTSLSFGARKEVFIHRREDLRITEVIKKMGRYIKKTEASSNPKALDLTSILSSKFLHEPSSQSLNN